MSANVYDYVTYEEFLNYPSDDSKIEYYNGQVIYNSSVHPIHNKIQNNVYFQLRQLLQDRWEIYTSGVAIKFETEDGVYQFTPDLFMVCNNNGFNGYIYTGEPLLVVEVLSKDTESRDRGIKLDIYEKCGVATYWIIDIDKQEIVEYTCNVKGEFRTKSTPVVGSHFTIAGNPFDLAELFQKKII